MKKIIKVFGFISDFLETMFEEGYNFFKKILIIGLTLIIYEKLWESGMTGKLAVVVSLLVLIGIYIFSVREKRLAEQNKRPKEGQFTGHCGCHQNKNYFDMGLEYHKYFNDFISKQNSNGKK